MDSTVDDVLGGYVNNLLGSLSLLGTLCPIGLAADVISH